MKTYEHNTNKPLLYTEKSEEPIPKPILIAIFKNVRLFAVF